MRVFTHRAGARAVLAGIAALFISQGCRDRSNPGAPQPLSVHITALSPTIGRAGDRVEITGENFSAVRDSNHVTFTPQTGHGADARIDSLVPAGAPTHLYVNVPLYASTGRLTVRIGSSSAVSDSAFTVAPVVHPHVDSMVPSRGHAGTVVTIYGSDFDTRDSAVHVVFGDVATLPGAVFANRLAVEVPEGATTGAVRVVMYADTFPAGPFTVVQGRAPYDTCFIELGNVPAAHIYDAIDDRGNHDHVDDTVLITLTFEITPRTGASPLLDSFAFGYSTVKDSLDRSDPNYPHKLFITDGSATVTLDAARTTGAVSASHDYIIRIPSLADPYTDRGTIDLGQLPFAAGADGTVGCDVHGTSVASSVRSATHTRSWCSGPGCQSTYGSESWHVIGGTSPDAYLQVTLK